MNVGRFETAISIRDMNFRNDISYGKREETIGKIHVPIEKIQDRYIIINGVLQEIFYVLRLHRS